MGNNCGSHSDQVQVQRFFPCSSICRPRNSHSNAFHCFERKSKKSWLGCIPNSKIGRQVVLPVKKLVFCAKELYSPFMFSIHKKESNPPPPRLIVFFKKKKREIKILLYYV